MSATESQAPQAAGTGPRKLEGRVALVTGGTRGIGAAIARDLAAEGAVVAAGFSSNREKAEEFLAALEHDGHKVTIHQGNVGDPDDCQRTISDVMEQHGRLDILVNNAGITADRPVMKMTADDWFKVLRVNLSGAFFLSKAALEHMVERGTGRIVNISSIVGQMGNIGQANYAASKSGLVGLTMTMAREAAFALSKAGKLHEGGPSLTVNAVSPGYIETDMLATVPEKVIEKVKAQVPLGRLGRPEDISRMVAFLCEDGASYITGQVFAVNGGMEM
jgi:NAD(P)-dependent dehydrogenase (short-subunit alcohol dehydrogenase family)